MLYKKNNWILFIITILCAIPFTIKAKPNETQKTRLSSSYGNHYPNQVNQLLNQINPQEMWTNLTTLTSFPDRASYHNTGVLAANWLKSQIETMVQGSGRSMEWNIVIIM